MKFTEGMWRFKSGLTPSWVGHVERYSQDGDEVKALLTAVQRHRGDQLNQATIKTRISSPLEDVISVELTHWDGGFDNGPNFKVNISHPKVKITDNKTSLDYQSGQLKLSLNTSKNDLGIEFTGKDGEKVTAQSWRSIGYIRDARTEVSRFDDEHFMQYKGHMLAGLDIGIGEKLYGLGERFGPLVKNGQSVDINNEDVGTETDWTYKNVPFYLSSSGYGVFINTPAKVSLELQSERTTRVNISVPEEKLHYYVIYGPTPKEIINKYTALTGRPGTPPAWSYGLWLTPSFVTNWTQDILKEQLDGLKERDIRLGVFHFDAAWMKGHQWCDFDWDPELFPDAPGLLKEIHDRGHMTCCWLNPFVAQESRLFGEGKRGGYFLKRTDGTVWQTDDWQAGMAIVDFTNPEACQWWRDNLRKNITIGVDSFKTDFGERIPFRNVKWHDGSDPARMHNYYSLLYNKNVYETLIEERGRSNSLVWARSTSAGGQIYPIHWGGDPESTFDAMAESIRGALSLGICGFGYHSADIGGFEGTPSPTVYKRWVQFGLLQSHTRLHGNASYRVPWLYDGQDSGEAATGSTGNKTAKHGEASRILKEAVDRKISLMPYLLSQALVAAKQGTPLMRAMFLEFPDDLNTYTLEHQYMLGSNLLVAPVLSDNGKVTFYVPEDTNGGQWVSWFDHGRKYTGGKWYTETFDISSLPLLVRPGTVTPINKSLKSAQDPSDKGLEFVVNGPLKDDVVIELANAEKTHEVKRTVHVQADEEKAKIVSEVEIKVTYL